MIRQRCLLRRVQPGPQARVLPPDTSVPHTRHRGLRGVGLRRHGQNGPAIAPGQHLPAAAGGGRSRAFGQDFPSAHVVPGRSLVRETGWGETPRLAVDVRHDERQVHVHRHARHVADEGLRLLGLRLPIAVGVGPQEPGVPQVRFGPPLRPEPWFRRKLPPVGTAECRHGPRDPVFVQPDRAGVGSIRRRGVVAIRQVKPPLDVDGLLRRATFVRAFQPQPVPLRPVVNVDGLVLAGRPVHVKLHAVVEIPAGVLRVDLPAAAVFHGSVEGLQPLAVLRRPHADALGHRVALRHPETPLVVQRHPERVVHAARLVASRLRRSRRPDRPQELALRRKNLHLLRPAAVRDEEVARLVQAQRLRIVQPGADHHLRPGQGWRLLHARKPQQLVPD